MIDPALRKSYDLEDRTFSFARKVRSFVRILPRSTSNFIDSQQLIRSSGSVGANYIEANESLSKKDFMMRAKICRKEAKESTYWLKMFEIDDTELDMARKALVQEAVELTKIFGAIVVKSQAQNSKS